MTNPAPLIQKKTRLVELLEARLGSGAVEPVSAAWLDEALGTPLRQFLDRPGKEFRARLVSSSYTLAGGEEPMPEALPFIIEILHTGSLIIDDIQDGSQSRRGAPALHVTHGMPLALNAGNWLYFWALDLLSGLGLEPAVELSLHRRFARTLVGCHEGQALDLSVTVDRLDREAVFELVRATTRLKTGNLMQLAAELGASAAGARADRIEALGDFGRRLGVGLQMLDDLGSVVSTRRAHKGYEDLRQGTPTWPWAWLAEQVDDDTFERCRGVLAQVMTSERHPEDCARLLRQQVSPFGKRRVRAELHGAVDELRRRIGFSPALNAIHQELKRLEQSYD